MTWRVRLARLILHFDPEYVVCETRDFEAFLQMITEEEKVRQLIAEHDHLTPVLDLLPKRESKP
jgi:hypothetical protein